MKLANLSTINIKKLEEGASPSQGLRFRFNIEMSIIVFEWS